jgi:YHS domain-containing protein
MKTQKNTVLALALVLIVAFSAYGQTQEHGKMNPSQKMAKSEMMKADYPIDYCLVSGEKLGAMGEPFKYDHNGREIQFCCGGCVSAFEKDPKIYLLKLDSAIVSKQKESYPLETCVVTGEKLGSMGDPVDYVYNNQLVRFCCGGCIGAFEKEPDKYLKKLHVSGSAEKDETQSQEEHPAEEHHH